MAVLGADPEQLDRMAQTFRTHGQRTQAMANELDAHMRTTWWVGARSDAFRRDWFTSARPNMTRLAEDLLANATKLAQQANQQRQTSEAGSLGGARNGSGPGGGSPAIHGPGWEERLHDIIKAFKLAAHGVELAELFVRGAPYFDLIRRLGGSIDDGLRAALQVAHGSPVSKILEPISYALSAVSYGLTVDQYGFFDGRSYVEATGSLGGILAGLTPAGPLGALAWTVSFEGTGYAVRKLDEAFDTSGAFVNAVVAREGKVPNYDGPGGIFNWAWDGVENAIFGW